MSTISILHAIFVVVMLNSVDSEVFSATADVELLLKTQEKLIYDLEGYINMEKKRLNVLEAHLKFYKKEHKRAIKDVPYYIGNPVNCYTLIKRLTTDLEFIENTSRVQTEFNRDEALTYPAKEDLDGAIQAIMRLQDTYLLNATWLASGVLNGTLSHDNEPYTEIFTPMSASDCYEIGISLYKAKNYKGAIDWMMETLWKYDDNHPEAYSFPVVDVVDHIAAAYRKLDDIENALKWKNILLTMAPNFASNGNSLIEQYEKQITDEGNTLIKKRTEDEPINKQKPLSDNAAGREVYKALCRGEMVSPSVASKRLKCRYLSENNSFLKLAPIKMEELFTEPNIFLFHEVLNDDEINAIKDMAKPMLKRAAVQPGGKQGARIVVSYRTSKTAWLKDDSATVARITRRVSDFTGMSMKNAEILQVANYGIGGHYEPHYDFFNDINDTMDNVGNRIGTVLFYMSDVTQGGATVFTQLGLTVFPVKGAAVFWMNLHPSGEKDMDTRHAACPVLRGSKWVSNKWIRQRDQELLKPCNLEYQEVNYDRKIPPPIRKFSELINPI